MKKKNRNIDSNLNKPVKYDKDLTKGIGFDYTVSKDVDITNLHLRDFYEFKHGLEMPNKIFMKKDLTQFIIMIDSTQNLLIKIGDKFLKDHYEIDKFKIVGSNFYVFMQYVEIPGKSIFLRAIKLDDIIKVNKDGTLCFKKI